MQNFIKLCGLIFIIFLVSFKKKDKNVDLTNANYLNSKLKKITATMYAWETETSNAEYNNFLNQMKLKGNGISTFKLDTTNWESQLYGNFVFSTYYHTNPAFNNYPVVNVSYNNAIAYCNWLTETYNNTETRKFKKVLFTLPTQEEWITAASCGGKYQNYPWKNDAFEMDKTSLMHCSVKENNSILPTLYSKNMKTIGTIKYYTNSTTSKLKNANGLYNTIGNVAEMVLEKGITKGGSYNTPGSDASLSKTQNYTNSNPEIGFRVFMKIIEN